MWPSILALVCVFGHLGSLGTRGRRAMGALYLASAPLDVATAQQIFSKPDAIMLRRIDVNGPDFSALVAEANTLIAGENNRRRDQNCREGESKPLLPNLNLTVLTTAEQTVQALALWLKHHRAYKLMPTQLNDAPTNTSFRFAKRDHDRGADSILRNGGRQDVTYRSAVGLPIIQRFHGGGTVKWEKNSSDPKGRFASPVLLRPCRDMTGKWHALVIFVEARKWPDDPATHRPREVYLNNQPRSVSLDLYNAMKTDPRLTPYPGLPEFPWDCRDRG